MEAIHNTMDHVMHPEDSRELIQAVRSVNGVIDVDDLRARELGHYVVVDLKISVNPHISVQEGHDIAKQSKQKLIETFPYVLDVLIHVNPYGPSYPYKTDKQERNEFPGIIH
jgi:divalent metal cation (Fe/Co/Zn/Cd) transporter